MLCLFTRIRARGCVSTQKDMQVSVLGHTGALIEGQDNNGCIVGRLSAGGPFCDGLH